jgi:uncharacterized NAD-dependent epimerase/dehydratase family protein
MIYQLPYHRILVLTEGQLGMFSSKTGASLLRYRPQDVVAVLDSAFVGKPLDVILPGVKPVPIVGSITESMPLKPDAVLVGVAPAGGALPAAMRTHLLAALRQGLGVISGLHTLLKEDPELVEVADEYGGRIHDIRDPGPIHRIAQGRARYTHCKRVLTVGTDCNLGKMVTALELTRAAKEAGLDAAFVATGQTGIMIEGWGIAIDHVLSDFTAGATEMLVEHVADKAICFIEGQGSLGHPAYSPVSLGLLHGSCPQAIVMCHRPGRALHNQWADCPVKPIGEQIAAYERIAALVEPTKVVAIALNTAGMPDEEAEKAQREVGWETGLPVADPIRSGPAELLAAVRRHVGI